MKKALITMVVLLTVIAFAGVGIAGGKMMGTVSKMEGDFVFVKDDKGKESKFHTDGTTKKTGDVKVGAMVEVEGSEGGHATSIMVKEMMKK